MDILHELVSGTCSRASSSSLSFLRSCSIFCLSFSFLSIAFLLISCCSLSVLSLQVMVVSINMDQ